MVKIMYNDLIPDDIQNELLQIQSDNNKNYWRTGDLCIQALEIGAINCKPMDAIYSAIGLLVGRSNRSVREITAVAKFFPLEIRERYDMLSFSHFRYAIRLQNRAMEALQWCIEGNTRPASFDAMYAHFTAPNSAFEETHYQPREETFIFHDQKQRTILDEITLVHSRISGRLSTKTESAYQDYVSGIKKDLNL